MSNKSPCHHFLTVVTHFIARHRLLNATGKYLVALSGGADSVALLRLVLHLGYDVEAVHCNFRLRGKESDRDEAFCKNLCLQHDVPFHVAHFETREYAEAHHQSIEMAARNLRYSYFRQLKQDLAADGVLVAHHKDDSVETILINLIRGTGIRGLTGIAPKRDDVLRPLLCVSKKEILEYLEELKQEYITDSSNLVDDVIRNKIRLNIMPQMCEINPSVCDAIMATAEKLSVVTRVFDDEMKRQANAALMEMEDPEVKAFHVEMISTEGLLFHILYPLGFKPKVIEDAYRAVEGRHTGAIFLSERYEMLVDRDFVFVMPLQAPFETMRIPIHGQFVISEKEALRVEEKAVDETFQVSRDSSCACLDASKVTFPLFLRSVRPRDRFAPFGMKGTKLVSDFLTDLKVNYWEKSRQLVVTDAEDHILWLVGRRPANPYRITKTTCKALILKWIR